MKRPRVRISTLMLLVVIAALTVALVVERRRSATSQARADRLKAEMGLIELEFVAQQQDMARLQAATPKAPGPPTQ